MASSAAVAFHILGACLAPAKGQWANQNTLTNATQAFCPILGAPLSGFLHCPNLPDSV